MTFREPSRIDISLLPELIYSSTNVSINISSLRDFKLFLERPEVIPPDGFELAVGLARELDLIVACLNQASGDVKNDFCLAVRTRLQVIANCNRLPVGVGEFYPVSARPRVLKNQTEAKNCTFSAGHGHARHLAGAAQSAGQQNKTGHRDWRFGRRL